VDLFSSEIPVDHTEVQSLISVEES
jgi:hypothetical protein